MKAIGLKRIASLFMALAMTASLLAACGKKDGGSGGGGAAGGQPSQAEEMAAALGFVYVPEYFSLPDEAGDSYEMCYYDGMLYFTYYDYSELEGRPETYAKTAGGVVAVGAAISVFASAGVADPEPATGSDISIGQDYAYQGPVISLMRVGIDGTGLETLAYEPTKLAEGAQGDVGVNRISVDSSGAIWVVEYANEYHYDESENYVDDGQSYYLRKLAPDGSGLSVTDLTHLKERSDSEYFYINQISFDKDGYIYVSSDMTVFVLDPNGEFLFDVSVSNWIQGFVTLGDGSMGVLAYEDRGLALKSVDVASKSWGKDFEISGNVYSTYSGNADYDFFYNDGSNLFGYDLEAGEATKLINWISADVNSDYINSIIPLEDGRILCTSRDWSVENGKTELIVFTKKDASEVQMKTALTLACMWLDQDIKAAVLSFNKTNPDYRIDVTDYSQYNDYSDYENEAAMRAGLTKLTTEIISGSVPDLLLASTELPMTQYISKGLLEDLYPYIDSDPELGRDQLMESVLRAMEVGGGLYEVSPSFNVMTVIGRPEDVGTEMGWTIDELSALIASKPEGTQAFSYMTRDSMLLQSLIMDMGSYVDWETGKCSFDSEDFIKLLEFSMSFPEEISWDDEEYVSEVELIMSGQVLLTTMYASDLQQLQMYKAMFGGDVTFVGFPSSKGNGAVFNISSGIAMSSTCKDKEAAWSFMRELLTEEYQNKGYRWQFPTNKASFDAMIDEAMTEDTYTDENGAEQIQPKTTWGWDSLEVEIYATTQQEYDQIMALINSTTGTMRYDTDMMSIVTEEAKPFFAGQKSAQEVATIIQGRVTTYVNEQR